MGIKRRVKIKSRIKPKRAVPRGINTSQGAAPVAYGSALSKQDMFPLIAGTGSSMIVQNYELVSTLGAGNNAFTIGGNVVNPGLATAFPWLATLAKNYNKFRWRNLRYIYVPACSTASAGTEFMYFKYDYLDNPAANLTEVMATENAVMGNVWHGNPINDSTAFAPKLAISDNINCELDVSRLSREWYVVRTGNNAQQPVPSSLGGVIPAGLTFSPGNIYDDVAQPAVIYYGNFGTAGTATNGYLFAAYTVEFIEPMLGSLNS